MDRVCMRPGCDRPARARLAYDTVTCQVWLDQLPERSGRSQEICDLHAGRLTVPRGWMLCDRRDEAPALFVADVVEPAVGSGSDRRERARRRRPPTERLRNLFDEIAADASDPPIEVVVAAEVPRLTVVEPTVEPEPTLEPEPEPAVEPAVEPAAAAADADHDEHPSLQATSPLLARAFRQTGPQRSVLTQSTAAEPPE